MISQPPQWKHYITPELLSRAFASPDMQQLIQHAGQEYVYWDKFKHYPMPAGLTKEEAWAVLKFSRTMSWEKTPISDKNTEPFYLTMTKKMYQQLSLIDLNTGEFLQSRVKLPTQVQKNQLILSGLSEEAIASSQIEGANTSRKVAQAMILSHRKPRNRDEQMIVNNYQIMQRLIDWQAVDLTLDMLLNIQQVITTGTLDDEGDAGRFRNDADDIQVVDASTGLTIFTPPTEKICRSELNKLLFFANNDDDECIHPIVKASMLHFWLAYLHPFVDGNGRTARALFYWYLLKRKYWLFQYVSISRVIKRSRVQYDDAYLKSELDDNDLTYFILYQVSVVTHAIDDFVRQYEKKKAEDTQIEQLAKELKNFNERQVAVLSYLAQNPNAVLDVKTHQTKNQIAYQTARTDLLQLVKNGLLTQQTYNKKFVYVPNIEPIRKLIKKN